MPVSLYVAPARGGKTAYLIDLAREMARNPMSAPRVIVPTRLQARAWRERLAQAGGALGVRVGTFDDVYSEILRAAGIVVTRLSDPVQVRLLRAIAEAADLTYYRPLCGTPGFVLMLRDLFAELKAGGIFPARLGEAVADLGAEPRLSELVTLYDAYQVRLQRESWADRAGVGWLAAEALEQRTDLPLSWPGVMVDGFDDLTSVQIQVLRGLVGRVREMVITLTGSMDGPPRPMAHQRFLRTRADLEAQLGIETRGLPDPGADSAGAAETARPRCAPALGHLEQTLYTGPVLQFEDARGVAMIAASDREGEVREALRWLKQRLVIDGMAPGEVALLARSVEPYRSAVLQIADEYGLPVQILGGRPLRSNPAVAALLGLLALTAPGDGNLAWRETVAAWRSPYFDWRHAAAPGAGTGSDAAIGIESGDADVLEQVARWGRVVGGSAQWEEAFALLQASSPLDGTAYRDEETPRPPEALPIGAAAEALCSKFRSFVARITPPHGARSCGEHVGWLEALIGDVDETDEGAPWDDLGVARSAHGNRPLWERDEAALNAFKDLLRGLVMAEEAVGASPVEFGAFLTDLIAAVDAAMYRLPAPSATDPVLVADVQQARGVGFRAVAILGVAEGEFPASQSEDPLLRNADREQLRGTYRMPIDPSTTSFEAQAFYEAITRTREALLITRPRMADNGARWQPSPYWEEVRRRIAVRPLNLTSTSRPAVDGIASWPELLETVASARQSGAGEALWAWIGAQHPDDVARLERGRTVLSQRLGPDTGACDGDLLRWHAVFSRRYRPERVWSASRLESYRACPFLFYIGSVLGLEPRQEPAEGLDARQLGNIYHHTFELLMQRAGPEANLAGLLATLPSVAIELLDAAPRIEQFRETAWWQQTREEITSNVARSLRALDAISEGFTFYAAEQTFGIQDRPGDALTVRDGAGDSFRLRGYIDRVDRSGDGNIRIVDYKTAGKAAYTNGAVTEGKKLQLPLYARAAHEALGLGEVTEGFYWHVRQAEPSSLRLSRYRGDEGTGPEAAMAVATRMAWQAVRGARAGHFVPKAPIGGCPAYCPAAAFCWHYVRAGWG